MYPTGNIYRSGYRTNE